MKEFSLDSLTNDTEDVVSRVNAQFGSGSDDGSASSEVKDTPVPTTQTLPTPAETPMPTPQSPPSTTEGETPESTTSPPTPPPQTSRDDSSWPDLTSPPGIESGHNSAASSDQSRDSYTFDFTTTAPPASKTASPRTTMPTLTTATPTLAPTPTATPGATANTSAFDSTQNLAPSGSASSMTGGAIAGIVLGVACALFLIAAFVAMKKRRNNQRLSLSKMTTTLGDSQAIAILGGSKLAPPGAFGKLNSDRNQADDPNMSGGFFAISHDDPFTRKHMRKGGIWDDPVLVAARIPLEKIRIQGLLARGGFGQVFTATYNGQTVAVKTLLPETAQDMTEINALFAETKVMAKLSHPCVVGFIGIAWDSLSSVCCVIEYVPGGDLRAMLNNLLANHTRPRGFDREKVKIALDIAHGLTYLHSMEPNIMHRDLKSRNVLLDSAMNAKLTDFGVSRERVDDLMTNAVGTSLWMAPEVMLGGRYDCKADVFSFGVVLSELDTHFMPYANVRNPTGRKPTEAAILQMVAVGELQAEFSRDCPLELLTLAHACISVDPEDRPTAAEALYKLQLALQSFDEEEGTL